MTNDLLAHAFSSAQQLLVYMLLLSAQLALILALRTPVARYLGAATAYRLWALPLLWLPLYVIELPTLDWSWVQALLPEPAVKGVVSWFPLALQEFDIGSSLARLDTLVRNPESASGLWRAAFSFWLAGTAVLIALQLLRIHQFGKALARHIAQGELPHDEQTQVPAGLQVCFVNGLTSPALFGILQPRLLLPYDFLQRFDARTRPLIIKHEAVHYRRRDNLWNLVAMLLCTLFWFNPLLHMAWRRFRLDQELACDERVLQGTHPDEGKQYARTLLESMSGSTERWQPATITAWGNLRELRERTQMIRYRFTHKPNYAAGKYLLALSILVGAVATTTFDGTVPQVLAADETPMTDGLSPRFRESIEHVMQLRDAQDYVAASAVLEALEQYEMNAREQYTLLLFRAALAQLQHQYSQAIDWYEAILALVGTTDDQRRQVLMHLGSLHYAQQDLMIAIDYFQRFLDMSEDPQPEAVLRIAYAYYQLGDYEHGIPYAEQAIELGNDGRNTYALLRAYYLSSEYYEDARRINDKMIALFDQSDDHALEAQFEQKLDDIRAPLGETGPRVHPTRHVQPNYPVKAISEGIEGWAQVQFTVTEKGTVADAIVVEAEPEGYFEVSSLQAIRQFEFPVSHIDGQPASTRGVKYIFRYNLSN